VAMNDIKGGEYGEPPPWGEVYTLQWGAKGLSLGSVKQAYQSLPLRKASKPWFLLKWLQRFT
jgi:hypothetical protein